jgi:hypothetical protein
VSAADWSVVHPADNSETMLGIRRALGQMVHQICEAHDRGQNGFHCMRRAKVHARRLQAGDLGVWACRGPCAALSMVSGLVSDTDSFFAAVHVQELAELCWRAHGISAVLSPYADDLECQEFVGAFERLSKDLRGSEGR